MIDLGVPMVQRLTLGAMLVEEDGRPRWITVAGGDPSHVAEVDALTGERLAAQPLPDIESSWALTLGADGGVYIAGTQPGVVLRYDRRTGAVRVLGPASSSSTLWAVAAQGPWVHAVGYPGGNDLVVDTRDGSLTDTGQLVAGKSYGRSVAADERRVFVGLGIPPCLLVREGTGPWERIPLPGEEQGEGESVRDLELSGNRLLVTVLDRLLLLDAERRRLVRDLGPILPGGVAGDLAHGRVLYLVREGSRAALWAADLDEGTPVRLRAPEAPFGDVLGADNPRRLEARGDTLYGVTSRGQGYALNLVTGEGTLVALDVPAGSQPIQRLAPMPTGLLGSGYLAGDSFVLDATSGTLVQHEGPGQAEGILAHSDGTIYYGTYPGGRLSRYDPREPWAWTWVPARRENPRVVAVLGHEQDRPFALAELPDGRGASGSVPGYGRLGGALSFYDPRTGTLTVHRPVIADQSVITLVVHAGLVLGGTSISGGLGVAPRARAAALFAFDPRSGTLAADPVVLYTEWAVDALAVGPQGQVFGLAWGSIFQWDPLAARIVRRRQLTDLRPRVHDWGLMTDLVSAADGTLVALHHGLGGAVLRVDPVTLSFERIMDGATRIGVDGAGRVHVARGGRLLRL